MNEEYEIEEFNEDGASDELASLIGWLTKRIDQMLAEPGFCSVDVSGVRANIAMLATIIRNHGYGHVTKRAKVEEWARHIDECFTNEEKWGFTPWPPEVKNTWRAGCRGTIQKLLDVLEDDDD